MKTRGTLLLSLPLATLQEHFLSASVVFYLVLVYFLVLSDRRKNPPIPFEELRFVSQAGHERGRGDRYRRISRLLRRNGKGQLSLCSCSQRSAGMLILAIG